jgi:hypothetical protein
LESWAIGGDVLIAVEFDVRAVEEPFALKPASKT